MKKKHLVKSTFGLVILIIIAAVVLLWLLKAPIVASYLSHKLGVKVSVGGINFSKEETNIRKFKINNPIGARTNTAFSSQKIDIQYSLSDLRSDPGVIDNIDLSNAYLAIELYNTSGTRNNWTQILQNLDKEKDKDSKEIIIKRLIIRNLSVSVRGKGLFASWKKIKDIPYLEFKNISSKTGFPTEELIKQIFDEANLGTYVKEIIKQPVKVIDKFLSPFTPKK